MSITWTFEGRDVSTHNGIRTMKMAEQTSFLSIASVTGAHSGNYTCIARNRAGEDRYSTSLHIKGIQLKLRSMYRSIYPINVVNFLLLSRTSH